VTAAISGVLSALGSPDLEDMFLPAAAIAFMTLMVYAFVPPLASQGAGHAEQAG